MIELGIFLHYLSIAIIAALTSLGVGIAAGYASITALAALNRAPNTYNEVSKIIIVGLAVIETGGILGLVMALLLLIGPSQDMLEQPEFLYTAIAQVGIAFALGVSGLAVALASATPAKQALLSLSRQPFFSSNILNMMLMTQSIIQTPVIFGFLISLLIRGQYMQLVSLTDGIRLMAAGLCTGIGCIGPVIGLSQFAGAACQAIGKNRSSYGKILPFTLISQAIIETPIIFSLLVSLLLLFSPLGQEKPYTIFALLASALCAGIGTFGPGISSGKVASAACKEIALNPEQYSILSRTSMLGQGLIDSAVVYALIVSLAIFFLK